MSRSKRSPLSRSEKAILRYLVSKVSKSTFVLSSGKDLFSDNEVSGKEDTNSNKQSTGFRAHGIPP